MNTSVEKVQDILIIIDKQSVFVKSQSNLVLYFQLQKIVSGYSTIVETLNQELLTELEAKAGIKI